MKRIVPLLLFAGFLFGSLYAQSASKGMKALNAKDYTNAWKNFEVAAINDPNDAAAQFGLSKMYGIEAAGRKDKDKALEHLLAAEAAWAKLDKKSQSKLSKLGVTTAELTTRRTRIESSFLEVAKKENTLDAYNAFLKNFPNAKGAIAATNYRNALAWEQTQENGSIEAMDNFIANYPDADEVKTATPIRDERATVLALQAGTEASLTNFLDKYPSAVQAPQIKQRLNAVAFENAKITNTAAAFKSYIERFPDSVFITQAKERLEWLESKEQK